MNLGLCIVNLLKRHQAVEVPGIGVFKITRTPAVYDAAERVIRPPARQVELDSGAGRGFPITAYLRAQQRVDEAKARQLLGRAVADIMETMSRNGRVLLDGLGYLLADGASLVLRPFDTGGVRWMPIKVSPAADDGIVSVEDITTAEADVAFVEDIEVIEAVDALKVTDDTVSPVESMAAAKALATDMSSLDTSALDTSASDTSASDTSALDESRSGTRVWGWIAAIAAVLIVAATWTWYQQPEWLARTGINRFLGSAPGGQAEGQLPAAPEGTIVADSIPETDLDLVASADSVAADSVASLAAAIDSAAMVPPPPAKPAVTYEIIVGSFATMAQADKYVAQMKAKGYELQAIDSRMPGNRKKISWGSYATEEEAYRELARVQKNFESGAWIAKVDNSD